MTGPRAALISFALFSALCALPLSAKDVWTVTASFKLDPRLVRQLEDLAKQNRVTLQAVSGAQGAAASHRSRGNLEIELSQAESVTSLAAKLRAMAGDSARDLTPATAAEGCALEAEYASPAAPRSLRITAAEARGFHNALLRVPQFWRRPASTVATALAPPPHSVGSRQEGKSTIVSIADFPSFPERGIVEGFYGKPWSHEDRLTMLRFEGQHAMNVYYYAPKDDPYHRKLWREHYPPAQMKRLGELADTARANFVDFCFAISPGLSMVYSSDQDFAELTGKLASVSKLGVSCFALFLDDVPQDLQNPQDKTRFTTLAAAHVYVINRLYHELKSQSIENRLAVTPTTYTNEFGKRDYVRELGAGVDPAVPLVWTGTRVVPPTITVAQAEEWGAMLGRKPLVWDNFPVNDGIPWRVNLGPMRGRDPNLPGVIRGLFSNPMNQPRASMIPVQTIAEYLWNSEAYDPDAAELRALTNQYGRDAAMRLEPFLKTYGDYWWDDNIFKPLFTEERRPIDVSEIKRRIPLLEKAIRALSKKAPYATLMRELAPLPPKVSQRLAEVLADPAFRTHANEKLVWRDDYDVLYAPRMSDPPRLDGDFAKWRGGPLYVLDRAGQIFAGHNYWRNAGQFSVRFALGWDANYLYVGADVTDSNLYQPFIGRDIKKGDIVSLVLETAFRKNFYSTSADGDEYQLFFSPGDFADVKPSVYSDDDSLPPRPVSRDFEHEIETAWKKTDSGFSGDIAIPAAWFDDKFQGGYEIGVSLGAQKALPKESAGGEEEEGPRIVFHSKTDRLFPVHLGNPSTYQRLVLIDSRKQ